MREVKSVNHLIADFNKNQLKVYTFKEFKRKFTGLIKCIYLCNCLHIKTRVKKINKQQNFSQTSNNAYKIMTNFAANITKKK